MAKTPDNSYISDIVNQVFTYRALVHAISGATGGTSAITVFYPLNKLRLVQQVEDKGVKRGPLSALLEMLEKEGIQSMFQGWWSTVVSIGVSNFVYFYTYNAMKVAWMKNRKLRGLEPSLDPVRNLVVSSVSGVVNVFLTLPLWVVSSRLTVQHKGGHGGPSKAEDSKKKTYDGILDALVRIAGEEGVAALWKSLGSSLWLVSNPAIHFVVYEQLRKPLAAFAKHRGRGINSLEFFILGALAKAAATVLTYPLQVAQSKLRVDASKKSDADRYRGTIDCLIKIWNREGVEGLFRGMEAKLWQTVLTAAFQYMCYEQIARTITGLLVSGNPPKPEAKGH